MMTCSNVNKLKGKTELLVKFTNCMVLIVFVYTCAVSKVNLKHVSINAKKKKGCNVE